jgi:hypothetical protein
MNGLRGPAFSGTKKFPFAVLSTAKRKIIHFCVPRVFAVKISFETVEKPASEKLMENVQMQGFRNPEE